VESNTAVGIFAFCHGVCCNFVVQAASHTDAANAQINSTPCNQHRVLRHMMQPSLKASQKTHLSQRHVIRTLRLSTVVNLTANRTKRGTAAVQQAQHIHLRRCQAASGVSLTPLLGMHANSICTRCATAPRREFDIMMPLPLAVLFRAAKPRRIWVHRRFYAAGSSRIQDHLSTSSQCLTHRSPDRNAVWTRAHPYGAYIDRSGT
jgi:hypothetical protein